MVLNKKGAEYNLALIVLLVVLVIYVFSFAALSMYNGGDFVSSAQSISDFSMNVIKPIFGFLLNLNNQDPANGFLIVLTFILMVVIITGTLDSVNIFGGSDTSNRFMNLAIGVIVSIIGVRFMPSDIWASLTAPSSALVASVLVGIPFAAIFFIGMKIKSVPARKVLWLFYFIFMSYLIFKAKGSLPGGFTGFSVVYVIFLILSGIMLFFDGTIRALFYREKAHVELAEMISKLDLKARYKLRKEIEEYNNIIADSSANDADRAAAKKRIVSLEKIYGDLSVI
jgi:hypothetical protein